jgi:hypothetical protein
MELSPVEEIDMEGDDTITISENNLRRIAILGLARELNDDSLVDNTDYRIEWDGDDAVWVDNYDDPHYRYGADEYQGNAAYELLKLLRDIDRARNTATTSQSAATTP